MVYSCRSSSHWTATPPAAAIPHVTAEADIDLRIRDGAMGRRRSRAASEGCRAQCPPGGAARAATVAPRLRCALLASMLVLAGCGHTAELSVAEGMGPHPQLPPPASALLPTVNIAPAKSWPEGRTPVPARGLQVSAFARDLDHPRWMYVLPNGDVLVAETNKPPPPEGKEGGIKGWFMKQFMKQAGAAVPSANRITLLRDADGDGVAEVRDAFLTGLHSPFGMALVRGTLYVANANAVVAFPYRQGATRIDAPARKIADLPAGRNHHWTKSLVANAEGSRLYVGVGSNSNIAEHGLEEEVDRAAILEIDPATGATRIFASGMRNPVGMDWNPESGALWVAVNERDEMGSDVPPDYMTSVQDGGSTGGPGATGVRTSISG